MSDQTVTILIGDEFGAKRTTISRSGRAFFQPKLSLGEKVIERTTNIERATQFRISIAATQEARNQVKPEFEESNVIPTFLLDDQSQSEIVNPTPQKEQLPLKELAIIGGIILLLA